MAAGRVDLIIEQGEDFTAQVIWNDFTDNPIPVVTPMRMMIKSALGGVVVTLDVPDPPLPETEIPPLTYNTDSGMIQIHIPSEITETLAGGMYAYDLYCNVDDGEVYAGYQQVRLIYGNVTVGTRVTTGI